MLSYIRARNIAIIDEVELELQPGLSVFTGETGAGKSLILGAVGLLLGNRAPGDIVRAGEERAEVEGVFQLAGLARREGLLEELGLDPEEQDLPIARTIVPGDKRKRELVRIGGVLTTLTNLRTASRELVDLASQHEHVHLLNEERHGSYLDSFARVEPLLARVREGVARLKTLDHELSVLEQSAARRAERIHFLEHGIEEISGGRWKSGEDEHLRDEIRQLSHAVEVESALLESLEILYEGDDDVLSTLDRVTQRLGAAARWSSGLQALADQVSQARIELEEAAYELRDLAGRSGPDPARLDSLQARLANLEKLMKRYGVRDADGLLALLEQWRDELDGLGDLDSRIEAARKDRDKARSHALSLARDLHEARTTAAAALDEATVGVLARLSMERARFITQVEWRGDDGVDENGGDRVVFLLAANPGEPPRPLAAVASGGELSRVLLALKAALADAYPVPVYIFDEVDTGIGGKTAFEVGRMLSELSRRSQVICVSHLAQIAAWADHHFLIHKAMEQDRTMVRVKGIQGDERVRELARMMAGDPDSDTGLAHARELLARAGQTA